MSPSFVHSNGYSACIVTPRPGHGHITPVPHASLAAVLPRMQAAPHCDAVELNCGCPQRCARQGGYGAFLMEQPELVSQLRAVLKQMIRIGIMH